MWNQIVHIKTLAELPVYHAPCAFSVVSSSDGLPVLIPSSVDLGCLSDAYITLPAKLSNPGTSRVQMGEGLSSHPTRVSWIMPGSRPNVLEPGQEFVIPIFLRAAGLAPGRYDSTLSLQFRSILGYGHLSVHIVFSVAASSLFRLDVAPRTMSLARGSSGDVSIECCNFSDVKGRVLVEGLNLGAFVRSKQLYLDPRQVVLSAFKIPAQTRGKRDQSSEVIFRDMVSNSYISVPVRERSGSH